MDREIKIIILLIVLLFAAVVGLVMVSGDLGKEEFDTVVSNEEWKKMAEKRNKQFIDTSYWSIYTSEEYAYEMKYPQNWEFNLTDGTTFHPENCMRNKYDKCVGRVSVAVFPDTDESGSAIDLEEKCNDPAKQNFRNISGDVWVCEKHMSPDFASANGYNRKREYYFIDNRGSVFEIDIMYTNGESVRIEEEMLQTVKLKAK